MEVNQFLKHYASKYYDPNKAHDYYERTKQLKGKRSTAELNAEGKEVWKVTKSGVMDEKKANLESAKVEQDSAVEQLRARAEEFRASVKAKLEGILKQITDKYSGTLKTKTDSAEAKIKALPKIPEGINSKRRAQLLDARKKEIANIRKVAAEGNEKLADQAQSERANASSGLKGELAAVSEKLKASINAAREKYKAARASITKNTESTLDSEFNKIASTMGAKKKR